MEKGFESLFRSLLQRAGARRLETGVDLLFMRSRRCALRCGATELEALMHVYEALLSSVRGKPRKVESYRFYCDAGLGGLARWLRAAGYEAFWKPGIDDYELLRHAKALSSVVLTTDSMM